MTPTSHRLIRAAVMPPVWGLVAALMVAAAAAVAAAGPAREQPAADGTLAFVRAAEDYTFMHRRLERQLPPLEVNANPETIRRAIDAMAAAIRAARPDARQGDLFNPAVQATLRERIARALRAHGLTPADVRKAEVAEGIDPASVVLRINATFPWRSATAMFPTILEALPPVPPELQYRLVGRDLVLVDVHASLIVDILPLALAEPDPTDRLARKPGGALWD